MNADGSDMVERADLDPTARSRNARRPSIEQPTIDNKELPQSSPSSPIATEWNYYRREVGRLLAEGNAGKWVLIKGEQIIGIWDKEEEADQVRLRQFCMQPVLLKQICVREPVLRGGGYLRPWHG